MRITQSFKKNISNPFKFKDSVRLSPLLTHFERWSRKKKKLLLPTKDFNIDDNDKRLVKPSLPNFDLQNNPIANLLSSPIRRDRISKAHLPKELLMQAKYLPVDMSMNKLQLVFPIFQNKKGRNSYLANSEAVLLKQIKGKYQWVPPSIIHSSVRKYNLSDISIEKDAIEIYKNKLVSFIEQKLVIASKKDYKRNILKPFRVTFKTEISPSIMIRREQDPLTSKLIQINLDPLKYLWVEKLQLENDELILNIQDDYELIYSLFKLIYFTES
ncbi:hypothetical protein TBLA_0E00610 [Henningerozyma blattae CBS 6284]|uniref:Required for respiratory growth protein 8, mitochondrial n=1 Tax=Henningerozyma blattae (strain ATCC 34711 / CBS 6284 / DSM 70876 / NBRC 10599 / NRRL Y-10934 / UCD 77-7) TaxID=1071380 RepID=I2H420_HENB6|nr:hypothetical protein TBLA_0E00610 [Tetrapisispora blattae CBS 6284]CCH61122.1 hypothetical protein TBLA_0E00610 [Tetrapisispora blattae CBS 6284]